MVGTTRFELATSPTPILETTQSEQLSKIYQYFKERETTRRNAYWTRNGPIDGPTLVYATQTRHERQPAMSLREHQRLLLEKVQGMRFGRNFWQPRSDENTHSQRSGLPARLDEV